MVIYSPSSWMLAPRLLYACMCEFSARPRFLRNAPDMDLGALGLGPSSARVRVGRNLASFPLPGAMSKEQRCAMEEVMSKAYLALAKLNMPEGKPFGGRYYSLTPGRPDSINDEEYKKLIKEHLMFKDMAVREGRSCWI